MQPVELPTTMMMMVMLATELVHHVDYPAFTMQAFLQEQEENHHNQYHQLIREGRSYYYIDRLTEDQSVLISI